MSKLIEKAYIDKIRDLEQELNKKDEYIQTLKLQKEKVDLSYEDLRRDNVQLRQQLDKVLGEQINRVEHEQLKITNERLKLQYHNVQKRIREVTKFMDSVLKGGIDK